MKKSNGLYIFEVGDRVINYRFGKGTVVFMEDEFAMLVKFDEQNKYLHRGSSIGTTYKKNSCYWMFSIVDKGCSILKQ
jgi:hypothetical protein